MKITKFIIPLVLGLAGGLIAYFIADNFGSKTIQSTLQHQIVGPGAVRPVVHKSENDVLNDSAGPVDLRNGCQKDSTCCGQCDDRTDEKGVLWKSFGILVWRSTTPDA